MSSINQKNKNTLPRPSQTYLDGFLGYHELEKGSSKVYCHFLHYTGTGIHANFYVEWGKVGAKKPQYSILNLADANRKSSRLANQGFKKISQDIILFQEFEKQRLEKCVSTEVSLDEIEHKNKNKRKM